MATKRKTTAKATAKPPKRVRLRVVPAKGRYGGWDLVWGRRRFLYGTKALAVRAGAKEARALWRNAGTPAQLEIHTRDGRIESERTYGNDPCPPRG